MSKMNSVIRGLLSGRTINPAQMEILESAFGILCSEKDKLDCIEIAEAHVLLGLTEKSPAPPLRDMTKTVSKECDGCAVNDSCNRDRHFQGECSTRIPKANDVATESEKKDCNKCQNECKLEPESFFNCATFKPAPEKQEVPEEKAVSNMSLHQLADKNFALNHSILEKVEYLVRENSKPDTVKQEEKNFAKDFRTIGQINSKQEEVNPCESCKRYDKGHTSSDCEGCSIYEKPESEANMDFSNALKLLKMGNKVKRVGWSNGIYVFAEKWQDDFKLSVQLNECDIPFSPKASELEATDWMLHID